MAFSGFQDFNPDFSRALQALIAASPGGISINSGYRSNDRQAELFARKLAEVGGDVAEARRLVAPPIGLYGSKGSRHTHRIAADLAFATPEAKAWAHENAEKFGLNFRMGYEPWHIELMNGKPQMVADPGPSVSGSTSGLALSEPAPEQRGYQSPGVVFEPTPLKNDYSIKGVGDILELANLIAPKRSAQAQQILKNIREYS